MRFMSPLIRVKSEFKGRVRIAWCHNLGTNVVKQAVFKEDDDVYQTWDNVWADIYFQFYQDGGAGKRETHNIGVGNVACLENWSEFLPSYPINVDQPWFYSLDNANAFPIFYKNSQTRAEHRYKQRRKIADLLRVQILGRDNKWKNTIRNIHKYLDMGPSATLKLPELWGRYAYITEPEIKWYKCGGTRSFFIRNIESCDTPNPNKYKSIAQINLHCTNPCLAVFWVSENLDATANHNYSNYTTDIDDLYSGWDPIKTTTLKYGTIPRLDNMPSDHFSIAEQRKHFPSAPSVRGYHGYSFASDSSSFHGDIGMVFDKMNAILQCIIANNNIFTNATHANHIDCDDDDDDITDSVSNDLVVDSTKQKDDGLLELIPEEASPSFITHARLLVIRKFTITPDGENKYKFTIT